MEGRHYQMPGRKLNFMFYRPPVGDFLMNRIVAWYDPPYSHTELVFEDGIASSICAGETVSMHTRNFGNPHYDIVTLSVPEEAYTAVRQFCSDAHSKKVGFDRVGMFASGLPVRIYPKSTERTFCSRFIVEALQVAGVPFVRSLDSGKVSPSQLHKLLNAQGGNIFDTVPGRCMRIRAY